MMLASCEHSLKAQFLGFVPGSGKRSAILVMQPQKRRDNEEVDGGQKLNLLIQSDSKPLLALNLSVRPFSVTVRTT